AILQAVIDNIPFDLLARDCRQICFLQNEKSKSFWGNLIGKKHAQYLINKNLQKSWKNNNRRALNGEIINEEITVSDKSGVKHVFNNVIAPIYNDNEVIGILGLNIEITEQKKAEKDLTLAKEKAEESDKLKSAFLANMSHEIRTPMNGIIGFVNLLETADLNNSERKLYTDLIKQSSERLLNTINDIIEISKIESGQAILHYSPVNLRRFMDFLYGFFQPEAENKKLKLSLKNECLDLIIKSDESKLQSILTNLLKNALKFTKYGSIEFGCYISEDQLIFFVKDTGTGIPNHKLKAIFHRFVQADYSTTKPYEGSGLGLSIAREYARMLNGNIRVKSEENKGSTFWFEMKYKRVTQEQQAES
ncbi:MAG: ATP-binding protein, partial [Prolixibacteraceae bacterium]